MFKRRKSVIHNEKLTKLLNNGWRYAIIKHDQEINIDHLKNLYHYKYQAVRIKKKNEKIILLSDLFVDSRY